MKRATQVTQDVMQRGREWLFNMLHESLDLTMAAREKHYEGKELPKPEDVDMIIRHCSNENMVIGGAMAILPPPEGFILIAPELGWQLANQIKMIYDIGLAYGKKSVMSKELIALILLGAMTKGAAATGMVIGARITVQRPTMKVFNMILHRISHRVSHRASRTMLSKFIVIFGPIFMASWSKMETYRIGCYAKAVLSRQMDVYDNTEEQVQNMVNP